MTDDLRCARCEGCGRLADTEGREPWSHWETLPLKSAAAVIHGLVKPIPCDECGGTGRRLAVPCGRPLPGRYVGPEPRCVEGRLCDYCSAIRHLGATCAGVADRLHETAGMVNEVKSRSQNTERLIAMMNRSAGELRAAAGKCGIKV